MDLAVRSQRIDCDPLSLILAFFSSRAAADSESVEMVCRKIQWVGIIFRIDCERIEVYKEGYIKKSRNIPFGFACEAAHLTLWYGWMCIFYLFAEF